MADTRLLGRWGEELAADYLRKKRYAVVGLNYRCRMGEIDIIAENREYVVFCEVKLRRSDSFAQAREFVTRSKQEKLRTAARLWLCANETVKQPRFDVIEVYAPEGTETLRPKIIHIENAF